MEDRVRNAQAGEEERVVLVDADGRDLLSADGSQRTLGKAEAHRLGSRHRAVSVFVFDGERVLLQRRAEAKYHSGGLWTNTCCTHPRPGEAPAEAATRRLAEEMGVRCELVELFQFTYHAPVGVDVFEHEFDHVFSGEWRGTPTPLADEVSEWRWAPARDLADELEREPWRFTYWLRDCFARVLATR
ncbi:MAG: isopentenyl-diphosphate Delta-isomerase [Planctomycetes bacterium]|nr:isopentenyl-diphosphate Delta-isomerase [Planctomycetota bacterium]